MIDFSDESWDSLHSHPIIHTHSVRMAKAAERLADFLQLNDLDKHHLVMGCYLHDLGKNRISTRILEKKEALTNEEWRLIKLHPLDGARMAFERDTRIEVIEVILFHHERWDGTGYPFGLKGTETPALARICSILDAFDSMMNDRPYRNKLGLQTALNELRNGSSTQFDVQYVNAFINWVETIN